MRIKEEVLQSLKNTLIETEHSVVRIGMKGFG